MASTGATMDAATSAAASPPYRIALLVTVMALCNISFMAFNTVVGPIARKTGLHEWQVGVVVSVAGLCWMLSSRFWGRTADRIGRVPVMRRGLAGFTVIFTVLSIAMATTLAGYTNAWFLFIAMLITRGMLGVCYSAVPVAGQALIADAFVPAQRAGALAAFGAGGALGMVFGPALAALLATFDLMAPMIATVGLGAVAWWISAKVPVVARPVAEPGAPETKMSLRDKRLRWPSVVAFAAMFCVMSAQVNTAFFLMDQVRVPALQATQMTGFVLTAVGFALILAQMLVRANAKLAERFKRAPWSASRWIMVGAAIASAGFATTTMIETVTHAAIAYFVVGFGMGLVFPAYATAASLAVKPEEQGVAMGTVGAAQAAGMVAAPVISTTLYHFAPALPYWAASIVLAVLSLMAARRLRARA
jgi:MFS transporter, DHA1 family, tetracycline resistance protein